MELGRRSNVELAEERDGLLAQLGGLLNASRTAFVVDDLDGLEARADVAPGDLRDPARAELPRAHQLGRRIPLEKACLATSTLALPSRA